MGLIENSAWARPWGAAGLVALALALPGPAGSDARADLRADHVHGADTRKTRSYIRDGLFTGGDHAVDNVIVRDIRHAVNPGYERIVVDLGGSHGGETATIIRAPYYQVAVNPDEKRLILSVFGSPRLSLRAPKVKAGFRRSAVVKSVNLLPAVDPEAWTAVFELKANHPVEVFELANPVRIIIDIKTR